jgi:hypothetical protein
VLLEDSYHIITLDNENQRVAHEVGAFFLGNLSSKPAMARTVDVPLQISGRKYG